MISYENALQKLANSDECRDGKVAFTLIANPVRDVDLFPFLASRIEWRVENSLVTDKAFQIEFPTEETGKIDRVAEDLAKKQILAGCGLAEDCSALPVVMDIDVDL